MPVLTKSETREAMVLRLRSEGQPLSVIASRLGVRRERVQQIIRKATSRRARESGMSPSEYFQALTSGAVVKDARELGSTCSVYFVGDSSGGLVKIGSAVDPYARLRALSRASPSPLTLIGFFVAQRRDEVLLHEQFDNRRVRGEWFELSPEIEACIDRKLSGPLAVRCDRRNA